MNNAQELFASLLGDKSIKKCAPDKLREHLVKMNLLTSTESFNLSALIRKNILDSSYEKDTNGFRIFWEDVSEVFARSNETEDFFISIPKDDQIFDKIFHFLADTVDHSTSVNNGEKVAVDIDKWLGELCFSTNIDNCLTHSRDLLDRIHVAPSYKYSIHEAIEALCISDPTRIVKIIEVATEKPNTTHGTYLAMKGIERLVVELMTPNQPLLLTSMVTSRNALLRSLAIMSHFSSEFAAGHSPNPLWLANHLTPVETILALAEWCYELRLSANRKGGQEDGHTKIWLDSAFNYMCSNWPNPNDITLLEKVINRASGPGQDGWATSNYQDLSLPLVKTNIFTAKSIRDFWYCRLDKRMKSMVRGGHFYGPVDSQITAAAAHAVVSDLSTVDQTINEMHSFLTQCITQVLRPRIKTTQYSTWHNNTQAILWTLTFLEHLLFYSSEITEVQNARILGLIAEANSHTLERRDISTRDTDDLTFWAKRVHDERQHRCQNPSTPT